MSSTLHTLQAQFAHAGDNLEQKQSILDSLIEARDRISETYHGFFKGIKVSAMIIIAGIILAVITMGAYAIWIIPLPVLLLIVLSVIAIILTFTSRAQERRYSNAISDMRRDIHHAKGKLHNA